MYNMGIHDCVGDQGHMYAFARIPRKGTPNQTVLFGSGPRAAGSGMYAIINHKYLVSHSLDMS